MYNVLVSSRRLAVYFAEKEVFWRDDSGFVELPKWILVRSFLTLGYDGTTKAGDLFAAVPLAVTFPLKTL